MSLPEEVTVDPAEGSGLVVGSLGHHHGRGSRDELTPLGKTSGSTVAVTVLPPTDLPRNS